jgi:hypothetical protein
MHQGHLPHCFEKKDQSPHILGLQILLYLVLKSSYVSSGMNSPYAQAYNHINETIISIGID